MERRVADDSVRRIGIFLFPGVEELDAVGPWEVLSFWTRRFPEDGWEVFCFSPDGGPVVCAKGLTVAAHCSLDEGHVPLGGVVRAAVSVPVVG
ncbi:DJ-1/PfpI family protein [Streptomyces sp. NPDC050625]|uniref:DJ-1/PfpI family protein n=1 Tax=Streptomyces sp. NPDC050625 TaxID=3154629 RepID=UPI003447F8F2